MAPVFRIAAYDKRGAEELKEAHNLRCGDAFGSGDAYSFYVLTRQLDMHKLLICGYGDRTVLVHRRPLLVGNTAKRDY